MWCPFWHCRSCCSLCMWVPNLPKRTPRKKTDRKNFPCLWEKHGTPSWRRTMPTTPFSRRTTTGRCSEDWTRKRTVCSVMKTSCLWTRKERSIHWRRSPADKISRRQKEATLPITIQNSKMRTRISRGLLKSSECWTTSPMGNRKMSNFQKIKNLVIKMHSKTP